MVMMCVEGTGMGMTIEELEPLEDPRHGNAERHSLHDILVIALCTILCGGETCTGMALFGQSKREFLESFLPLRNGIPSHDTFSRVFRLLEPAAFQRWFLGFMRQFAEGCEGVLAVDGKTLRRSFDRAEGQSPLHLVSAWASEQRLVLGQLAVDGKSNEITAVPRLLEMLTLPGMVVTADAMHCQRQLPQQLLDQGAGYVLALKGNQESMNDGVRLFLDDPATDVAQASQTNKGHGRIETRTASISSDVAWLQERRQWPGLAAVGKITARRQEGGHSSVESRYYLLSQAFSPERFNQIARAHWGIENQLHWVLDVVFNEDQSRNRKDNSPDNLALLRKLALNLARLEPSKGSMRGKLKRAGWDNTYLATLLFQFTKIQMR